MRFSLFLAVFLLIGFQEVFSSGVSAENSTSSEEQEDKVNLGWPNFFNPEKAILRKKEGIEKKKKAIAGDKASILGKTEGLDSLELLEENRLANQIKDSEGWREEWNQVDLKIKDGLRGTFELLTNATSVEVTSSGALPEEERQTIQTELSEQYDVYEQLSEVSDDGLRLATPLFRLRYSDALAKYGAEITYFDGEDAVSLIYFGNWCGRGGRIAPVDNIDRCCLERAKCYGRTVGRCPDVWEKPYPTMYAWTVVEGRHVCVRSGSTCINRVCACDVRAAQCMRESLAGGETEVMYADGEETHGGSSQEHFSYDGSNEENSSEA